MADKPESRKMEFVFCRFHFEGLFSQDVLSRMKAFLLKAEEKFIQEDRFNWAFGDVGTQTIDNDEIIFGRLGRTITKKFGTVYDQEKHSYRKDLIKSSDAAYSNFFIIPKSHVLALEDKNSLTRNMFVKKFKEFWSKNDYIDIKFEFLKDEVEIFEFVKTWDRLSRASFYLVPSNPDSREDWKDVDELIRKAKAKPSKSAIVSQNSERSLLEVLS